MRNCITHHYACDCREEKFRKMEADIKAHQILLEKLVELQSRLAKTEEALAMARRGLEFYLDAEWIYFSKTNGNNKTSWGSTGHGGKTARTTLSTIDAILSEDERKGEV